MFCPNCGENLPDDSKFCGACGANLMETISNGVTKAKEGGSSPMTAQTASASDRTETSPNRNNTKKIAAAVAAVAVIAVVFFLGIKILGSFSGGKGNAYAYLADGDYELITDVKKGQSVKIDSSRAEYPSDYLLAFSPDGKYVYYYTKCDFAAYTGTLCRAEFGKLKEDTSKNSKYIEVIASNVSIGFEFLKDGTILYKNGDSALYYYDGKEPERIAKSVNYYYTDDSKRVAYVTGDYNTGYKLYGVNLNDIENDRKLASNFSYICSTEDFDHILYIKQEDDYSQTLYVVGFDKDPEKLGKNVNLLNTFEEKIYFTMDNGEMLNLYDYVEDDYDLTDYTHAEIRRALEDRENAYPVKTLYCYADGKMTEINDKVLSAVSFNDAIMFNTVDLITEKVRMKDINSIYDVNMLFMLDYEAENFVVLTTGTDVCRMSRSAARSYRKALDNGYAILYFLGNKEVYMGDSEGVLSMAPVSKGEIGEFQEIAEDVEVIHADESKLYYVRDSYKSGYRLYGDLYVYENGKESRLAKDIMEDIIYCYEDGAILAYTDYRENHGYELTMFDSQGKSAFIGEDVTQFIRVDKSTILYISDKDLYCYNGKDNVRIKRDVDWVWSMNSMEVSDYLSYYGYYDGE